MLHTCQLFWINRSSSGFQKKLNFFFEQKITNKLQNNSDCTISNLFFLKISRGGPPDPLYSQIKLKNNSDCNTCNLVWGKFPWVDPSIGDRAKRGPSPLFRLHITNKCSGFRLFNVGRYELLPEKLQLESSFKISMQSCTYCLFSHPFIFAPYYS